jgi:hypothetical protein
MNLKVPTIGFAALKTPEDALIPLARIFLNQQIGYASIGPDDSYNQPWSPAFDDISVRHLINRLAEHLTPSSSWILCGTKHDRLFAFAKGGFRAEGMVPLSSLRVPAAR